MASDVAGSVNKPIYYGILIENTPIISHNLAFQGSLFLDYMCGKSYSNFFPHFNGGAFLIKEEYCSSFKSWTTPSYAISTDEAVPHHIRHIGVQYGASFALCKISDNWSPFDPGFNFLLACMSPSDFGASNISLLH